MQSVSREREEFLRLVNKEVHIDSAFYHLYFLLYTHPKRGKVKAKKKKKKWKRDFIHIWCMNRCCFIYIVSTLEFLSFSSCYHQFNLSEVFWCWGCLDWEVFDVKTHWNFALFSILMRCIWTVNRVNLNCYQLFLICHLFLNFFFLFRMT